MNRIGDSAKDGTPAPVNRERRRIGGKLASVDGVRMYMTRKGERYLAVVRITGRPEESKGGFLTLDEALKWKLARTVERKREKQQSQIQNEVPLTRLQNLRELIRTRFGGNSTAMAKAIDRSHTYVWQLVNEYRAIGEKSARHIEGKLNLAPRTLDGRRGALEATKIMIAQLGDGHTYHMAPRASLDLSKIKEQTGKPKFRPCPIGCSRDTVYFEVESESMEPRLHVGELAFVDPAERALEHDKIYVVLPNGAQSRVVRVARNHDTGFRLVTPEDQDVSYEASEVEMFGRVIHVTRDV